MAIRSESEEEKLTRTEDALRNAINSCETPEDVGDLVSLMTFMAADFAIQLSPRAPYDALYGWDNRVSGLAPDESAPVAP